MSRLRPKPAHAEAYEYYFSSGYYDQRYPRPIRHVLETVSSCLPSNQARIIDFGCGTGRYTFALAPYVTQIAGFDISESALDRLRQNCVGHPAADRLSILGPNEATLDAYVREVGQVDVLMALFGVLSHIEGPDARRNVLEWFARMVKPDSGYVILSVPNRHRRFRNEQKAFAAENGEIVYQRHHHDRSMAFFYKLFDVEGFRRELTQAGLIIDKLIPESILPESWLTHSGVLNRLDQTLARWVPPQIGYGLLAVTRPNVSAADSRDTQWQMTA